MAPYSSMDCRADKVTGCANFAQIAKLSPSLNWGQAPTSTLDLTGIGLVLLSLNLATKTTTHPPAANQESIIKIKLSFKL